MSLLGTIAIAAVGTLIPGAGIAIAIAKLGKDAVLGSLKSAATWLFVHPMALVAIVAVLFGLWQLHGKHSAEAKIPRLIAAAAAEHKAFTTEQAALRQTVANYRAASTAAQKANDQHVQAVEAAQNQKSQEVSNDYEARLAVLRRQYDAGRVRDNSNVPTGRPDHGPAGPVQGPVISGGSGGSDGPTAPRDEIDFNCQANALQLEELQRWVREQAAIPVEPPAPAH